MTSNISNLLLLFLFHLLYVPTQLQALNTDGVLLLSFKYSILSDPLSVLHNWNYDDETPCLWTGVTCSELGKPNEPDMFRVTSLVLPNKHLLGSITPDLFSVPHLKVLDLSSNFFNGSLPDSAFNATELRVISLGSNNLSGDLPKSIINSVISSLQLLNLSANAFTGQIPLSLSLLKNLTVVSLTKNSFSGDIPSGFEAVQVLDLSSNLLNDSLPKDLGGRSLQYLNLSHNKVLGEIPSGFAEKFPAKAIVDLSFNNLTGLIPTSPSLLNQKVESFSGNTELCGKPLKTLCSIPSTLSNPLNISGTTSPAIAVKPRSSAPINPLTDSPNQTAKSKLKPSTIVGITVADIAALAIIGLFILYVYQVRKRRRHPESSSFGFFKNFLEKNESKKSNHQPKPSVVEVTVTESPDAKRACGSCITLNGRYDETSTSESDVENQQTVQAFDRTDGGRLKQSARTQLVTVDGETKLDLDTLLKASAYILGTTGTGIVYKAVLENGTAFAVRRIETESCAAAKLKEFEREVRAVAKLRHPNLVRIRGFCWGNDEKLLISDYVPNGSLLSSFTAAKASSSSSSSSSSSLQNPLCFEARLKIARGIARGLSYINEKKHVHGNIKPNNILLNAENEPIITDLGLDRLMTSAARESHTTGQTSSSPYQPPEWSTSQIPNPKWDVYSFGVILLELLTCKVFPVDEDVDQWSNVSGSETEEKGRILRLIDGAIRSEVARHEDAAIMCFRLGIGCVSSLPQKRPSMKEIVQVLEKIMSV